MKTTNSEKKKRETPKGPTKFKIDVSGDIDATQAFRCINNVISMGLISGNNNQHCYHTAFESGIRVICNLSRTGVEHIRVTKI